MKKLTGKTWKSLSKKEQQELLIKANCVDGMTGNNAKNGECIVDIGEYSISGNIINDEIIIADNAAFYNPAE